ncbi:MAG: hypothetical protein U0176_09540 [Bacteroidia bacterium]
MRKQFMVLAALYGMAYVSVQGQTLDTLRVMFQNLLAYPQGGGGIPSREDTLAITVQHVKPDLLMVCELQRTPGTPWNSILTHALNINGTTSFAYAPFVNNTSSGDDLQQLVFYDTNKLVLRSQRQLATNLRDINKYVMYYKDPNLSIHHDTIFLDVYVTHLKASTGPANETMRDQEITILRNHVNTNTYLHNSILAGDFNTYTSAEPCYQTITTTGTYPFVDPINRPGAWNNNAAFKDIHTQCTRFNQLGGDGAGGGLDDRFDHIMVSSNLMTGADRVRALPATYKAIGQDGLHFNDDVNGTPTNTAVPANVARALYFMSDHLPVSMDLEFSMPLVMAVQVVEFQAQALQGVVEISGRLEGEFTTDLVSLERAAGGSEFQSLGPIDVARQGEFLVNDQPGPGLQRYCLRFTDADGNETLSQEAHAWLDGDYPWQVVHGQNALQVHLPGGVAFDGEVVATDLMGRELGKARWTRETSKTVVDIPLESAAQGIIIVTLTNLESGWRQSKRSI